MPPSCPASPAAERGVRETPASVRRMNRSVTGAVLGVRGNRYRRRCSVRTTARWAGGIAVGMLTLAGCADSQEKGGDAASAGGSGNSDAVLATADSGLGEIVVDGEGMTVYVFDQDSPGSGETACAADCLVKWPAVEAG